MFNVLDIVFILIILVFSIIATAKGFVKEIFNKASWILGIILGIIFCKKLSPFLESFVKSPTLRTLLAFLLIFMLVFLILQIIKTIIGHAFDTEIMGGLDKALGFFFGIIEGLAVVMLILVLLNVQPFIPMDNAFATSFFFRLLSPLIGTNQKLIPGTIA